MQLECNPPKGLVRLTLHNAAFWKKLKSHKSSSVEDEIVSASMEKSFKDYYYPGGRIYGISTHMWLILMVNK